jgi:hypothetical protein
VPRKSKWGEPNAFWKFGNKVYNDPWVAAIAAINNDADQQPLVEILTSREPLDRTNRYYLAELLQQRRFKDQDSDNSALVEMLRSDAEFEDTKRRDLADLLESKELVREAGQPPTPSYETSWSDALTAEAVERVEKLERAGTPRKRAVSNVSDSMKYEFNSLLRAVQKNTGSVRRKAQRVGNVPKKD